MSKKKSILVPSASAGDVFPTFGPILGECSGVFEQGYDNCGRPYEKKYYSNGICTKIERLKDGTRKLTIKMK